MIVINGGGNSQTNTIKKTTVGRQTPMFDEIKLGINAFGVYMLSTLEKIPRDTDLYYGYRPNLFS